MTSSTFFIIFIPILAIILLAVNLILAPHNPGIWFRKSNIRDNLPNIWESSSNSNYWIYSKLILIFSNLLILWYFLNWNILIGTVLICIVAAALYMLRFIDRNMVFKYYDIDILGLLPNQFAMWTELAIADSPHKGLATAILVIVLFAMMTNELLISKKSFSL